MKKPTLIKKFVMIGITGVTFFLWLVWTYLVSAEGEVSREFFYYLILLVTALTWYMVTTVLEYQKQYKAFIQNITLMGRKEKLVDYEVKEINYQGNPTYYLEGHAVINDKKHKIRKQLPQALGKTMQITRPVLNLYIDPTSTGKLTYHLDTESLIK